MNRIALLVLVSALAAPLAMAGPPAGKETKEEIPVEHSPFDKGRHEFQSLTGAYFSFTLGTASRATVDYSLSSYRLGFMLGDVRGDGLWRGNYEFLFEVFGGSIYEGPGNGLGGATLQLRYNFVQPDSRWVPYFQLGAGGVYSDMHKDERSAIGSAVNFNLQAAVGLRYLLNDRWAISLEGGYRHISNAGITEKNSGLDAAGVQIGLSRFF